MPCIALCEVSFIETLLVYFYFLPLKLTSSFCCQIGWFYFFRSFAFLFEHYYKMRCLFGMLSVHTTGGIIHFHCYIPSSHHSYSVCVWEGLYFTSQTFLLNKIKIKVKVKIYIFDISHPIGTWPILLYSLNERIAPDTNLTKNSKWQDNEQT